MDEWVSLEEVYAAYKDCRKRKRNTESCNSFEMHEMENLYALYEDLNNKTYQIGKSITFCVTRPKIREVFAATFRDRIVHYLLITKIGDLFEEYFIQDTYNCRTDKGTLYGHLRAFQFAQEYSDGCVLSCDISSFFMSIVKDILADRLEAFLRERYKQPDIENVIWLTRMIALHHPEELCEKHGDESLWDILPKDKSLFTCADGCGMAIGNLTSQIFANFYLSDFDIWMSSIPGIKYCRYVDDFRVFAHTKEELVILIPQIRAYLKDKLHLTLHPKKVDLQPMKHGFKFIGAIIKKDRMYVGNRTLGNFYALLLKYDTLTDEEFQIAIERFAQRYNSYSGFLKHYQTYGIRWKMWMMTYKSFGKYVYISRNKLVLRIKDEYKSITKIKKYYYDLCKYPRGQLQSC